MATPIQDASQRIATRAGTGYKAYDPNAPPVGSAPSAPSTSGSGAPSAPAADAFSANIQQIGEKLKKYGVTDPSQITDQQIAQWQKDGNWDALSLVGQYRNAQNDPKYEKYLADKKLADEQSYYNDLGAKYGTINESDPTVQARAKEIGDLYTAEIDKGMYGASKSAAEGISRRGLSSSGYGTAAQGSIQTAAASERAKARESALKEAIGETRTGVMGEAQIHGMGDPMLLTMSGNAQQEYMFALQQAAQERAQWMQMLGALGGMFVDPAADKLAAKIIG